MPLVIASVQNQESLGANATTIRQDIKFGFNVTAFHLDVFALKDEGTAATIQNLVDKITRVDLITENGNPESTIDMDDLFDAQKLVFGVHNYHSILTSTDNIPHAFGVALPMSPQPEDPTKNFGMPANTGIQFSYDTAADVNQDFDGYATDLTVEGVDSADKPNSLGYLRYKQDNHTFSAVGEERDTKIGRAKKLCGVLNWMTTSYDDLAAAAANDLIGIRTQRILSSSKSVYEYKPSRTWSMKRPQSVASFAAAAAEINLLDTGRWFSDFGIHNDSTKVGLDISGNPNVEVQSVGGVAEAVRICPITLV